MSDYADKRRMDRLEEAHAALEAKFEKFANWTDRELEGMRNAQITELSAENASENWNTCSCGHHGSAHDLRNRCLVEGCDCQGFSTIRRALEPPATPAPDPTLTVHQPFMTSACVVCGKTDREGFIYYVCDDHVPTAEPEPAPLDPVNMAVNELCDIVSSLAVGTVHMIGTDVAGKILERAEVIRAGFPNGRDGAR